LTGTYEIRDPIHGFIVINEWERDIINHPVFQRLRRIKQLAWTDMVYPGAMHTRFEHSLGVMHIASQMFGQIKTRREHFLKSELKFTDGGLERDYILIRLAGLLHDVGHAPFSHAGEELMPVNPANGKVFKHENYSAAAISYLLTDVIENHPLNQNYKIKAQDVADFLNGSPSLGRTLLWRGLFSSQLDADRSDYLLRDSHHIGVAYGKYDLHRLLATLTISFDPETEAPVLAIEEGGSHAAEGLIIARYMMFTQVYFQHTRRAYDHHIASAIKSVLAYDFGQTKDNKTTFPPPSNKENIEYYLKWDDWRVLGMISEGLGGEDGEIIHKRQHHRRVYETPEIPQEEDLNYANIVCQKLGNMVSFIDKAASSWYKFGNEDIMIAETTRGKERLTHLSRLSSVIGGLKAINQTRIYVPHFRKSEAIEIINKL
jgi:uncharacterized protein